MSYILIKCIIFLLNALETCELYLYTIRRAVCQAPPPRKCPETHIRFDILRVLWYTIRKN